MFKFNKIDLFLFFFDFFVFIFLVRFLVMFSLNDVELVFGGFVDEFLWFFGFRFVWLEVLILLGVVLFWVSLVLLVGLLSV